MAYFKSQTEYEKYVAEKAIEQGIVSPVVEFFKGPKGDPGKDAEPIDIQEVVNELIPYIPEPIPGKDGEDGKDYILSSKDKKEIVSDVVRLVPKPKDGISPKIDEVVSKAVEKLKKSPIQYKDIVDKPDLEGFLKRGGFRGGGASFLTQLNDINITSPTNGQTIIFDSVTNKWKNANASSGTTLITPTSGTLNQATFTWSAAPKIIFRDGVPMQQISTDGTVNWTGTTVTILSIWPTADIFALS